MFKINRDYIITCFILFIAICGCILSGYSLIEFIQMGSLLGFMGCSLVLIVGMALLISIEDTRQWFDTSQDVYLIGKKHDKVVKCFLFEEEVLNYLCKQGITCNEKRLINQLEQLIEGQQLKIGEFYIEKGQAKPKNMF